MAKPRMVAGRRNDTRLVINSPLIRIKLFTFSLLLLCINVYAQDEGPFVRIEGERGAIIAGQPWTLSLIVDHSAADEVAVISAPFPRALQMDRFVRTPRTVAGRLQTVIEYTFIPNMTGVFLIEPFTVTTPFGATITEQVVISVQAPAAETRLFTPHLVWERENAGTIAAGQRVELNLRGTAFYRQVPPDLIMPEVPQGAILSSVPLNEAERRDGILLKIYIIPLGEDVYLPARNIRFGNYILEIPALHIHVTGHLQREERIQAVSPPPITFTEDLNYDFPMFDISMFERSVFGRVWMEQSTEIYNTALEYWNNGEFAKALAQLRRYERDHPAGVFFQPIRRQAEESLGIFNTENESRWRRMFLMVLSFAVLLIVTVFPLVYFLITKKSFWKKAVFFLCLAVILSFGIFFIYIFMDARNIFSETNYRYGITFKTPVRRLADKNGQELFRLNEGQPVIITIKSEGWVFMRTNDNRSASGWIPVDMLIFY